GEHGHDSAAFEVLGFGLGGAQVGVGGVEPVDGGVAVAGVAVADFAGGVDERALQGEPVDGALADLLDGDLDELAAGIGRGHPAGAAAVAAVAGGQPVVAGRGGAGAVVGPTEHVGAGGVEFDAAVDAADFADPQVRFDAGEFL